MGKESALYQFMGIRMNGVMNGITNGDGEVCHKCRQFPAIRCAAVADE